MYYPIMYVEWPKKTKKYIVYDNTGAEIRKVNLSNESYKL
jgi:hypothetical protein